MKPFMSTVQNKIDAKGRVSFPSAFRAILKEVGETEIFCMPSLSDEALDGFPMSYMDHYNRAINTMNPFVDETGAMAHSLLAEAETLVIDNDGRIKIPESLASEVGIEDEVTFVGMGPKIQLWNPVAYVVHRRHMREVARENREKLGEVVRALLDKDSERDL